MNLIFHITLALLVPAAFVACDKSGAEAQREADRAQAKANTEITNATLEAEKKVNSAKAEASETIAKAEVDFAKTRADYRHTVQTNLADLDKRIADLEVRVQKGKKVDVDLGVLRSQRDAFAVDARAIETADARTWDATKERLDKEWNDLKNAVDRVR